MMTQQTVLKKQKRNSKTFIVFSIFHLKIIVFTAVEIAVLYKLTYCFCIYVTSHHANVPV